MTSISTYSNISIKLEFSFHKT